jgi:RecA-family ATPase
MHSPFVRPDAVPDDAVSERASVRIFISDEQQAALDRVEEKKLKARRNAEQAIAKQQEETRSVVALRASSFAVKRIQWLWTDRIPMGEVTLIAGRGGTGKSTMLSRLAADITNGTLPGEFQGMPCSVLYVVNEDSIEYTVGPRMIAAGADLDLVYYLAVPGGTLVLPRDCDRIAARAQEVNAACIMLDPLSANLGAKKNDQDQMRTDMQAIRKMCEGVHISAIGLAHTKKAMTNNLMDAILGSTELGNVCRSAMGVMADDRNQVLASCRRKIEPRRLDIASYGTALRIQLPRRIGGHLYVQSDDYGRVGCQGL